MIHSEQLFLSGDYIGFHYIVEKTKIKCKMEFFLWRIKFDSILGYEKMF